MSPEKTAQPIEMPMSLRTLVGPGNNVIDGGQDLPMRRGIFTGKGRPIVEYEDTVICAKTAEPIEISFVLWARMGPRNHVLDGVHRCRDVAMTTTFWLSIGYNFGYMIASDTLCDSMGGFWG